MGAVVGHTPDRRESCVDWKREQPSIYNSDNGEISTQVTSGFTEFRDVHKDTNESPLTGDRPLTIPLHRSSNWTSVNKNVYRGKNHPKRRIATGWVYSPWIRLRSSDQQLKRVPGPTTTIPELQVRIRISKK